ncbi:hypothetical protein MK079_05280 [Candidatus Gracilibacteria bacterium]|nr:hypothetical protein [Candidatus Gracilibacteria bacterium]
MFFRKKEVKQHAKKFDRFVTTLIIGGAVASVVGLSRTKKGQEAGSVAKKVALKTAKSGYALFGKTLVGVLNVFDKKKK